MARDRSNTSWVCARICNQEVVYNYFLFSYYTNKILKFFGFNRQEEELEKAQKLKEQELERLSKNKDSEQEKMMKLKDGEIDKLNKAKDVEIEKITKAKDTEIDKLQKELNKKVVKKWCLAVCREIQCKD